MEATDPVGSKLVASLRRYAPSQVRVFDANDESRDVAVPSTRSKWTRVASTVEARPWVRCELLDKKGAVLGYVENDGAPSGVEDLAEPTKAAHEHRLLELLLRAQREALQFQSKDHAELLKGCTEMMKVLVEATRNLAAIHQEQVRAMAELSQIQQAAAQGDDIDKWLALADAAPEVIQKALPTLAGLRAIAAGKFKLTPDTKPAPPNGAPAK